MIKKIWLTLDNLSKNRPVFLWFLLIWLIINLVQSYFTGLAHDEAYYWMYSRDLDWGYFDHPPMIAVLIKLGYAIFSNELGVRLFSTVLGTLVLYIIFLILKDNLKSISLLISLFVTVLIVQTHIGGFLAIPDLPMVFFAALFFLIYKKYAEKDIWYLAVILGLVSTGMLYSKYHGVLVLFFTLISNLKLLRRPSFYIIPAIIIVAMIPHLMWQINNDFPTFSYHLVGRSSAYSIDRTLNYLAGQLLIAGPFIGIMVFYHSIKAKTNGDTFLRAMKYNFFGFFGFFFLSSLKGHVEPHWTAIGFIPLIILAYQSIVKSENAKKWTRILLIPSIITFISLRVFLIFDFGFLPKSIPVVSEFHNWGTFAKQVKEIAGDRKVVFVNSFQQPSKYAFYSGGDFSHGLNSIHYRQNQYDLWGFEKVLQGEDVLLMAGARSTDTLYSPVGPYPYRKIDNFKSYYDVKIELEKTEYNLKVNESVEIVGSIKNHRDSILKFESADTNAAPRLCLTWHDGRKWTGTNYLQYLHDSIQTGESLPVLITMTAPKTPGEYSCYLSIVNDYLWAPFNSKKLKIIVKK